MRATATDIESIDFPGGDAVSDEGWDGRLVCSSANPHLLGGTSGWEIGTEKSPGAKADDDYIKRSAAPLDLEPSSAVYVCVTPRPWPKRHAWARARRAEGIWKDVRVVAAGDLEQWLESAPPVALWLARHLGLVPPSGFQDLDGWWEDWATGTRPPITTDMLLGGRQREVEKARCWFEASADRLEVQGDHPEEAIAFLAAASRRWPDAQRDALLARCVVTASEEAFRAAAEWTFPLVIAAPGDVAQATAGRALQRGHHLFLAGGRALTARGGGLVRLPRLDGMSLRDAMEAAGLTRAEAAAGVVECGRSIAVLRRRRAVLEAVRRPSWASPSSGTALVPALLAGSWNEFIRLTDPTPMRPPPPLLDRRVLTGFGNGGEYAAMIAPMVAASAEDDPPLRRVADVWTLTSPLDGWYLLGEFVEQRQFEALGAAAVDVLGTPDPKYELPDEQQWMAAVLGKDRRHSGWLRQGLATSLAIVANHGDALALRVPYGTPRAFANRIVASLLSRLSGWQGWASIGDVVPLLAEAAPEALLSAVEDLIERYSDQARLLMSDGGGGAMTSECRHAGLLWALERLAWHPDHLAACFVVLARLDAVDPGGRWANRPFATLRNIFLGPGDPYTFADAATCLSAIDVLTEAAPQVAWKLFLQAAEPLRSRQVRDPPTYLSAMPDGWTPWSDDERRAFWKGMQERLLRLIENLDRQKVIQALERLEFLPDEAQVALVAHLDSVQPAKAGEDPVWGAVRVTLRRVRSCGAAQRLAPSVLEALEGAHRRLSPTDPIDRFAWLFQKWDPQLAEGDAAHWREYRTLLERRRAEAAGELLAAIGPAAVVEWATSLSEQGALGVGLADVIDPVSEAALNGPLLAMASAAANSPPPLLVAYAKRRMATLGASWLDNWIAEAAALPDPIPALAALHYLLPCAAATWRRVEALGAEVEQLYWRWTWPMPEGDAGPADWAHALDRLLAAGRAAAALEVVSYPEAPVLPGKLLLRVGEAILKALDADGARAGPSISWELERLFEHFDRTTDVVPGELATLEWQFLPVLEHTERGPRLLHRELAANPSFFTQVVRLQCKRRDGAPDQDDAALTPEARANRAELAYRLLSCWSSPLPGQGEAGLDAAVLANWIGEARRMCAEADRALVGDRLIGELLARCPPDDDDGAWPHTAVRAALESLRNEDIEIGFFRGVMKGRGVTSRGLRDGGALERAEACRYDEWAQTIRRRSPHVARLLGRIADDYRAQARGHDDDADLNDLR